MPMNINCLPSGVCRFLRICLSGALRADPAFQKLCEEKQDLTTNGHQWTPMLTINLPEAADALARLYEMYCPPIYSAIREIVRRVIARTVSAPQEIDEELCYLCNVLAEAA